MTCGCAWAEAEACRAASVRGVLQELQKSKALSFPQLGQAIPA